MRWSLRVRTRGCIRTNWCSRAPGKIFVTRNVGNLVPAYGEMMGSTSAVIEYAVSFLKVKHIVVCGHTDCGAMKALLAPEAVSAMPTVKRWLRNAHTAMSVAEALQENDGGAGDLLERVTEQNVLLQMQHLRTHPSVAAALARGELSISGWIYDIARGTVRIRGDGGVCVHGNRVSRRGAARTDNGKGNCGGPSLRSG